MDRTTEAAQEITDEETRQRTEKTERLRAARLERAQEDGELPDRAKKPRR